MNLNSSNPKQTINSWLKQATNRLEKAGINSARLDSQLLLAHVLNQGRAWLLAHLEQELNDKQLAELENLVAKRIRRRPLAHLINAREFYGLDLYVNEHVLTPRTETERIVELAIRYASPDSNLIDVGTGSGAIAIAIKKHRPDLRVWGTDVTEESLSVARRNALNLDLDIKFIKSDLFENVSEKFSTVCANLPYLTDQAKDELMPEVLNEPPIALFGGADGLDLYRKLLRQLPKRLEPGGYLFTECDPWQQAELIKEAEQKKLSLIEQDYFVLGFQKLSA